MLIIFPNPEMVCWNSLLPAGIVAAARFLLKMKATSNSGFVPSQHRVLHAGLTLLPARPAGWGLSCSVLLPKRWEPEPRNGAFPAARPPAGWLSGTARLPLVCFQHNDVGLGWAACWHLNVLFPRQSLPAVTQVPSSPGHKQESTSSALL